MPRLKRRAFEILRAEVRKCAGKDRLSQIEQEIVLQELEKLRSQEGSPASQEELRKIVISTYPNFSEKSLSAAAKANRPMGVWGKIKVAGLVIVGIVVALGVLGTLITEPQPADNNAAKPEKKDKPKLPNPHKMNPDDNYREATSLVEQADRLLNQATGSADLALAEEKINQAKKHIDELPVSYYNSQPYISRKGEVRYRREKVYEDRFASIRSKVEQMQAQIFQENHAQEQLNQAEQAIATAKQQYQQAQTSGERSAVMVPWQASLDRLEQISSETFAGKTARAKLTTHQRDFQQFSGIEGAKQFAFEAAKLGQNPPHTAAKWRQIENQWEEAINRLVQVTERDTGYIEAQKLLATYKTNLGTVQLRRQAEEVSVAVLQEAKEQIESLLVNTTRNASSIDRNQMISQIQRIINQLENVKPGTTAYAEAQQLMRSAQNKVKEILQASPRTNFGN